MKTYINEMSRECALKLTETKKIDEWTEVVDLKPLKKAIEALETLGKDIEGLYVQYVFLDIDNKYYRRFPEEVTDKIYRRVHKGMEQKVYFEKDRLYFIEDGHKIACPRSMHSYYNNGISLEIVIRWRKAEW